MLGKILMVKLNIAATERRYFIKIRLKGCNLGSTPII